MNLKRDLLTKGYLPENLPPTFRTEALGDYLNKRTEWLTQKDAVTRATLYNASKRGLTRRAFSFIHPSTSHDLAEFISSRRGELDPVIKNSPFSLSAPRHTPLGDRALAIASYSELEDQRLTRLARYRFVARTDISRFYHSIYTHSIPWALHGKAPSKSDRRVNSSSVYGNRLDRILQQGQDGQTIGIPVGPDASRYVAEIIGVAIDNEFIKRNGTDQCSLLRHVDDVWIGADSHHEAESYLAKYREAIRHFELDINEAKTKIYASDFQYSDSWPTEIDSRIENAVNATNRRIPERIRSALEYAFSMTVLNEDDGVLKYTLRYIDRTDILSEHWSTVEPFLMRAVTHYSHTVDYVARMLVWRHLARDDLDIQKWSMVLHPLLNRHALLGNDAEVCWATYAALRLGIKIPLYVAEAAVKNCSALSVVAMLSAADSGMTDKAIFDTAVETMADESGSGGHWPLLLEWKIRKWPQHDQLNIKNALINDIATSGISIFDENRLPAVFDDFDENEFAKVSHAIEKRSSQYDDEDDEEDDRAGDGEEEQGPNFAELEQDLKSTSNDDIDPFS
jgi:hypothetical protein